VTRKEYKAETTNLCNLVHKLDITTDQLERQIQQRFLRTIYKDIYPDPIPIESSELTYLDLVVAGPPHQFEYQPKFLLKDQEVISVRPITQSQIIKCGSSDRDHTGTTQHLQVDNQPQTTAVSIPKAATKVDIP